MVETLRTFFHITQHAVHGGVDAQELARLGLTPDEVVDFSANQSPLGPSPRVAEAIARAAIEHYPDRDALPLTAAIAAHHGLSSEQVVIGNGSTELIRLIAQLALRASDTALALPQTFGEYQIATALTGATYATVPQADPTRIDIAALDNALGTLRPTIFWWCSPNNPTGCCARPDETASLVLSHPETLFILDEAYCDLLQEPQWTSELLAGGNLIILRSMTKAWGLAGLRLGYALGAAELMDALRAAKAPWNVNACAQEAGIAALSDTDHYAQTITLLREQRQALIDGLLARGWQVLPSAAAFFLVVVDNAVDVKYHLLKQGCLVRDCTSFGLPGYIRISPRHPEQNQRLLAAFDTLTPQGGRS